MRYTTEEGARSMGHGMGARLWGCVLLLCVLVGVSFVGCPAPEPTQETTAHDGNTIWRGETTAPDAPTNEQGNGDLNTPSFLNLTPVTVNKSTPLHAVAFIDPEGVTAGTEFFSTTNGGASWGDASPGVWQGTIYDLAVGPFRKRMLAVGGDDKSPQNGLLLISENKGANWKVAVIHRSESGEDLRFRAVTWLSEIQALAAGRQGLLYHTPDGENWNQLDSLPQDSKDLNWFDLAFVDGVVWMVGQKGSILSSDSNGTSWTVKRQVAGDGALRSIHFINDDIGIAVGDGGLALTTSNGGRSWEKLSSLKVFPGSDNFKAVTSNGANVFVVLTERTIWISKNRGRFWRAYELFLSELPTKDTMTGIAFQSADTFYISTTYGVLLKGTLQ